MEAFKRPYAAWVTWGALAGVVPCDFIFRLALLNLIYPPVTAASGNFLCIASVNEAEASSIFAWFSFSSLLFLILISIDSLMPIGRFSWPYILNAATKKNKTVKIFLTFINQECFKQGFEIITQF